MTTLWVLIASILSSGVVAAIISAALTDSKERRVLRRLKIEEIYLSTANWLQSAGSSFFPFVRVCELHITYNEALDIQIANHDPEAGNHHLRMVMNIEMYEPVLLSPLRAMET